MRRFRIRAGQRLVGLTAVAVATLGMATGCSADEQQASTELPSASSTSAEPTPDLPPLGPKDFPVPEEARVQDEAGAEAFLRYYVDLINQQQAIPSGEGLRALGPDCTDCLRIARLYDEAAQAGQTIRGGQLSVTTEPGVSVDGDEARISFIARVEAVSTLNASGEVVPDTAYEAEPRLPSGMNLMWSEEQQCWVVTALTIG